MRVWGLIVLAFILFGAPSQAAKKEPRLKTIRWSQTPRHYGRWKTVSGEIVATFRDRRYLHLHFHKDAKKYFTVLIRKRHLKRFPEDPEEFYLDKDVLVYGKIRRRGRRPVMILTRRDQIWVVGETLQQ